MQVLLKSLFSCWVSVGRLGFKWSEEGVDIIDFDPSHSEKRSNQVLQELLKQIRKKIIRIIC